MTEGRLKFWGWGWDGEGATAEEVATLKRRYGAALAPYRASSSSGSAANRSATRP